LVAHPSSFCFRKTRTNHHRHATPPPKPYLVSLEAVIGGVLRDSLIDFPETTTLFTGPNENLTTYQKKFSYGKFNVLSN